jgi:tol-pal system protein YbgF
MLRRSPLLHARPTLLLMVFAIALPTQAARSQDRAMQDRLDRLERDLSMLQRQVYRSAGGSAVAPGSSGAVDSELRMDRLETEMRELTGRVEDAINGVEQLRHRLEQINSDIDVRFGQGQGPLPATSLPPRPAGGGVVNGTAGALASRGTPPVASPPQLPPPNPPMPPGTLVPPPPYTYTPTGLGTLTPPKSAQEPPPFTPEPATTGTGSTFHPTPSGVLPAGSASDQYNFAFGLLKQADYPAAETALKSFIRQHPDDGLAGSAQYWLGETYYVRGNYAEAAIAFAEGYKRYPKGTKAPDDLLKLGMSLARANQKQNACTALAQLDHDFPNPGSAIKERAKDEKKKLGC